MMMQLPRSRRRRVIAYHQGEGGRFGGRNPEDLDPVAAGLENPLREDELVGDHLTLGPPVEGGGLDSSTTSNRRG